MNVARGLWRLVTLPIRVLDWCWTVFVLWVIDD